MSLMEEAALRFKNIPGTLLGNIPTVVGIMFQNWIVDAVVGTPNEFSSFDYDDGDMSGSLRDAFIVSIQDVAKLAATRNFFYGPGQTYSILPTDGYSSLPMPENGNGVAAFHSAYF